MEELVYNLLCIIRKYNTEAELSILREFSGYYWIQSYEGDVEFHVGWFIETLVISRVQFKNTRCGCMSECFKCILDSNLGFDKIIVQSVSTYEMYMWCLIHGFKITGCSMNFGDGDKKFEYGDYVYNIGGGQ